jgi:hypothetical protein
MSLIAAAAQAENLVFNGDFEAASARNPPPGWTMWGASSGWLSVEVGKHLWADGEV